MNDAERFDRILARAHDMWAEAAVAEARLFFTRLDQRSARRLTSERTDQVGELDGAPGRLLYLANPLRLARDREAQFAKVRSGGAGDHFLTRLDTLTRMLEPVRELGVDANAYAAVPTLRRFPAGLATEIRPDARTTLIGHSHGSTVAGQSLLNGVRYENVILTGSRGIDHDIRSATDLGSPGTRFFVARSPGDFVAYTQWHGPDPAGFPDVVRLRTVGGVPVDWHSSYYRPRSAIHAWDGDWKVTLTGETPLPW